MTLRLKFHRVSQLVLSDLLLVYEYAFKIIHTPCLKLFKLFAESKTRVTKSHGRSCFFINFSHESSSEELKRGSEYIIRSETTQLPNFISYLMQLKACFTFEKKKQN